MSRKVRIAAAVGAAAAVVLAPSARADVTPVFDLQGKGVWSAAQALRGAGIYTPPVVEGGWSAFAPIDDHTFWTVSDRGPNGQPSVSGQTRRTFLAPSFTPTIYKVRVGDDGGLTVLERIPLHLKAGAVNPARAYMAASPDPSKGIVGGPPNELTGLPQLATAAQGELSGLPADTGSYRQSAARDEVPYAADGVTPLGSDPYGIDSESIAVDPRDGSFWIGDEYRPSLVHVAADGTLLNRIIPTGVTVPADPADPAKFPAADPSVVADQGLLPRAFAYRRQNRGMEGGTLTEDGKTLFGLLQSSLVTPTGQGDARTLRLVRFDVTDSLHPRLTGEFVYRLDTPEPGSGLAQGDISNSDIYAIDESHLLVDEHDNVTSEPGEGQKRIIHVDLTNATDISDELAFNGEGTLLESSNAAGVTPVAKTLWLDLNRFGYDHDKPEGIGLFPNGDLAVQDDNDFGFDQGSNPQEPGDTPFKVTASGKTTELWRFSTTNIEQETVTGTVPATLALTLGPNASFGPFTPGVGRDYTATTTATVTSSAGDAALGVSDPGHLANGAFSLPRPLVVELSKSAWTGPVSNDELTVTFKQRIDATDALRTGTYARTLTFTLSTTTP